MGDIVYLAAYKREKGIAAPKSPYYTLNATHDEISAALDRAAKLMSEPVDRSGKTPYAVLVGFEDKKGRVKLLKQICGYSSREIFEMYAGRKGMMTLALITNNP